MERASHKAMRVQTWGRILCLILFLSASWAFGKETAGMAHLTDQEKAWITAHPTIRLAPDPEFRPIEYFDEKGDYVGMAADYARLVGQKLGIKFEIVRCRNWDDVIARTKRREVDVLNAVVKTPQREAFLRFPVPYLKIPSVIIVRKNVKGHLTLDMLKDMHILMVSGYGYVDLVRNKNPQLKIALVPDLKTALREVSFGMADGFVGDLATTSYYIESEGITNLRLAGEIDPPNVSGLAVRSDWPQLVPILEKGVSLLTEEEKKSIYHKWIKLEPEPALTMWELRSLMLIVVGIIAAMVFGFLLWNRTLRRMVDLRTKALNKELLERKRAEEDLRVSQQIIQGIINAIPVRVFWKDNNLLYLGSNETFARDAGFSDPKDIIGKDDYQLGWRAQADLYRSDDRQVIESGCPKLLIEEPQTTPQGNIITLLTSKIPLHNSQGEISGILGTYMDITDRKRMEESLRDSELRFRKIFEDAHLGIVITSPSFAFERANPAFCCMMGYSEDELRSMTFADLTHPDHLKKDIENVQKVGSGAIPFYRTEKRYIHRSGGVMWGSLIVSSVRGERGSLQYYISIIEDITKRKQAEEALRESEEMIRSIFVSTQDAITFVDLNGIIKLCNQSTADVHGYSSVEQLIGKNFIELIAEEDHQVAMESRMQVMNTGFVKDAHFTGLKGNGEKFAIELSVSAIKDISGNITGFAGITKDITDRKLAEEEKRNLEERLQRSEKMEALGKLAGGVAHDLNNVLGIISGYSEMLVERTDAGNPLREYAAEILQASEKAANIIQDLLTLARRGVVTSKVINLSSLVSQFLAAPEFDSLQNYHTNVYFKTDIEKNLLNINGSPVHLEKTLLNLVSNAAESIVGRGEVNIRAENRYLDKAVRGYDQLNEGDYVVLTVSDTGRGIAAADLGKIFEPFYTKKSMGRSGTGLGLAIVWGTVKDHKGYIDVQSMEGKGTTFTLYFPVTRDKVEEEAPKIPVEQYMGHEESILVVDDVEGQRNVARAMLEQLGYQVNTVSSGEEAVEYLKNNKADIIVLDMIMEPGIDGLETYQQIVSFKPNQKAIIVSGFSETARVDMAKLLGAGCYMKKPYMMEKIGVAIRDELKKNR